MPDARVTAVIVTHNSGCDLHEVLAGLADPGVQTVVVDNASTDDSVRIARQARADVISLPLNKGWSRGCNIGAGRASAPVLAFVNPDARPSAADLLRLARQLDDRSVGAVSPRFVHPDGRPQPFYFRLPDPVSGVFCFLNAGQRLDRLMGAPFLRHRTYDFATDRIDSVDQPGAACMLVRTELFRELGGFDDEMFLFFADTDFCRRLRDRGLRIDVDWETEVVHRGGGSVLQLPEGDVRRHLQRDYLVYLRRHHGALAVWLTRVAVVLLTGVVPALTRLLRGRPRDAADQVWLAAQVLR